MPPLYLYRYSSFVEPTEYQQPTYPSALGSVEGVFPSPPTAASPPRQAMEIADEARQLARLRRKVSKSFPFLLGRSGGRRRIKSS